MTSVLSRLAQAVRHSLTLRAAGAALGSSWVEADDPARNRCGCFLPDLTRLATAPSADFRRPYGGNAVEMQAELFPGEGRGPDRLRRSFWAPTLGDLQPCGP